MAVPLVIIKRNRILAKLKKAGAVGPETAVALEEAGVAKGDRTYPGLLRMMVREGDVVEEGGKVYIGEKHRRLK